MTASKVPHGPLHVNSIGNNSQMSCKISDFGHLLYPGPENETSCCKERHPSLLECVMTFPRCIWGWLEELMAASTSHIWSTSCHFYQKQLSKLCKMSDVGLPLCPGNKMMWYNGRCILLLMWSITAIRCITKIGRPSTTICKHLMVYIMSFLPKTTIKFHAKYHISGTLSARKMQWCATRRDIHCCLTVS